MNLRIVTSDELHKTQTAFEPFLFFQPTLLEQQSSDVKVIQLLKDDKVQAFLPFHLVNDALQSPVKAPFGGLIGSQDTTQAQYESLVQELLRYAEEKNINNLKLTQWPQSYAPEQAQAIHQALLSWGFKVSVEEVNQELAVTGESFSSRLHDSEKRRLKKSKEAEYMVRTGSAHHIEEYHALVQRNRRHKGHPLTISAEDLKKVLTGSKHHVFFAIYDKQKMIAAATGVRINASILYYYLPGNDPDYAKFSPMVLLLNAMYEYAQAEGITLLDLGISTSGGVMNEGLFRFKKHLGAEATLKLTYIRDMKG